MTKPQSDSDELRKQLYAIIKAPMRSQISTADIAVGMWSSTMLGEKVDDLEQFIDQALAKQREDMLAALPEKRVNPNKGGFSAASLTHGYKNTSRDYFDDGYNGALDQVRDIISNGGKK